MNSIYYGHLNCEVSYTIKVLEAELSTYFPIVRTLDSGREPAWINEAIERKLGRALSTMQDLMKLDEIGFFGGFDEIWVCNPDLVKLATDSKCQQLTNDYSTFNERSRIPSEMIELLETNVVHCIIGTGDGLSYATTNAWLADKIESQDQWPW